MSIEHSFMALFAGLERAHGTFIIKEMKGAKNIGKAFTQKKPVTAELWTDHFTGKQGLGIIPLRDDSTVLFGAVDIDSYENFDPAELSLKIEEWGWPVIVCRSKSGGAHLYMFLSEPVPSRILRHKLKQVAIAAGHPKAEIFPKQDAMFSKEDIGNWINMPYFEGAKTNRHAYRNGKPIGMEEFLKLAQSMEIDAEELEAFSPAGPEFVDAPPCIERLTSIGFPAGSMNNALFNMSVYARMKWPDDWQQHVYDFNQRFMGPGSSQEVQQIIKSVDKKKYTYKCSEQPICDACNKSECNKRDYGVTSEHSPYKTIKNGSAKSKRPCILDDVEHVICFVPDEKANDEPYWIFRIDSKDMEVTCEMVNSQIKFCNAYTKRFLKAMLPVDGDIWVAKINELLKNSEKEDLASDAGPEGQLFIHVDQFCNGKAQARVEEELLLGKPWKKDGRVFFRSQDLVKYLDVNRFKEFNERQLYAIFRRHGAKHHKMMIKSKCVACWSLIDMDSVQGVLDIPETKMDNF